MTKKEQLKFLADEFKQSKDANLKKLVTVAAQSSKLTEEQQKKVWTKVEEVVGKLKKAKDEAEAKAKQSAKQTAAKKPAPQKPAAKKPAAKKPAAKKPAAKTKGKRGPKSAGETFFGRARMIRDANPKLTWKEAQQEAKKFFADERTKKANAVQSALKNFPDFEKATKDTISIPKDSNQPAKPPGKRKSRKGAKRKYYWESRSNRSDLRQPPKDFPLLAKGGRPKSAHNRDHKYQSDEPHEKAYASRRKTKSRYVRKSFAEGGKITKEKFDRYVKVQRQGDYNMLTQADLARGMANLTKEEYYDIINNYLKYQKRFYPNRMARGGKIDRDYFYPSVMAGRPEWKQIYELTDMNPGGIYASLSPEQIELLKTIWQKAVRTKNLKTFMDVGQGLLVRTRERIPTNELADYCLTTVAEVPGIGGYQIQGTLEVFFYYTNADFFYDVIRPMMESEIEYDGKDFLEAKLGSEAGYPFARGGRPKSAHNRDHKYQSDEPHEKAYASRRKTKSRYVKKERGGAVDEDFFPPGIEIGGTLRQKVRQDDAFAKRLKRVIETTNRMEEDDIQEAVAMFRKIGVDLDYDLGGEPTSLTLMAKGGKVYRMMKRGGEVVVKDIFEGRDFSEDAYPAFFGDYDNDGVLNADDAAPLNADITQTVEQGQGSSFVKSFRKLNQLRGEFDKEMYGFLDKLKKEVPDGGEIVARTKSPSSIIKKLIEKRLLDKKGRGLTDVIGTTIVVKDRDAVEDVRDAFESGKMGKVQDFDDFYSTPQNGYRAYHFIVNYQGKPVEVQVKTKRQKTINELSHAPYKVGKVNVPLLEQHSELADLADRDDKQAQKQFRAIFNANTPKDIYFAK